jgi:flagellin
VIGGNIGAADTVTLGVDGTGIGDADAAALAVADITAAISALGTSQATVGTIQNRLQFAITLAQSQVVNTKAAESRIRDANIAEESANLTRFSILTQAGIAALAQANQGSAALLALLR